MTKRQAELIIGLLAALIVLVVLVGSVILHGQAEQLRQIKSAMYRGRHW